MANWPGFSKPRRPQRALLLLFPLNRESRSMNLSNEKNKLLNSVSRRAVALSDQPLFRVVTRGAMMGVALTAFVNFSMGSNPALAVCVDGTGGNAVGGADNDSVTCGVGAGVTADGYDTNGFDN